MRQIKAGITEPSCQREGLPGMCALLCSATEFRTMPVTSTDDAAAQQALNCMPVPINRDTNDALELSTVSPWSEFKVR